VGPDNPAMNGSAGKKYSSPGKPKKALGGGERISNKKEPAQCSNSGQREQQRRLWEKDPSRKRSLVKTPLLAGVKPMGVQVLAKGPPVPGKQTIKNQWGREKRGEERYRSECSRVVVVKKAGNLQNKNQIGGVTDGKGTGFGKKTKDKLEGADRSQRDREPQRW